MPHMPLPADHVCCQHLDLELPPDRPLCHFDGHGDQYVKLNVRQRAGWACFYCGKEPTSMVPVGHTVTDPPIQLFACNTAACRWRAWLEGAAPCCAMGGVPEQTERRTVLGRLEQRQRDEGQPMRGVRGDA